MYKQSFIIIGIICLTLFSCGDSEQSQNTAQQQEVIPTVEAVQSRFGALPIVKRFSGNVRSENQVPLYPEISARIAQVFVENGDYVQKGDVLVQLNDEQLRQQLKQANAGLRINEARLKQVNAQYEELKSRFNRTKRLLDQDLSSDAEFEQLQAELISAEADVELVEAQLAQSQAEVDERKNALEQTQIKAPISGTIGQRNAQTGMQVSPSTQLFMIGDLSKLRVEIILTERNLNQIDVGQSVSIMVEDADGNQQQMPAKISRISPFLNEVTRSTEAEIDVDNINGWLRPGMFVPIDVYVGESEQATLIPVSALYTDPVSGQEGVFVATSLGSEIQFANSKDAENSTGSSSVYTEPTPVSFKPVNILARGQMEVGIGGLESGKWVVTIGQNLLSEGREQAKIRTLSWERIVQLQSLQREDLLKEVLREKSTANSTNL